MWAASARRRNQTVLVLPGIGVGARYYRPLAEALSSEGFDVAAMELRGQGDSTFEPGRGSGHAGFHEVAAEDIPLALDHLAREVADQPVVLLGHSMGAQMGVYHLARRDPRVVGLIGVGTQSPFHRGYPGRAGLAMLVGGYLMPLIGRVRGSVPGRFFGAQGEIPTSRVRDWGRLATRNSLQPARADLDYREALRSVTVPILLIAIAGDAQAPESAARNLLTLVPSADGRIELEETELGHNRWAREPDLVVDRVVRWVDEVL